MNFEELMSMIEDAHKRTVCDKLGYFDYLSRLRDRLAVICVQLNTMEESFESSQMLVCVSRADYEAAFCNFVCDELSKILSEITNLLFERETAQE